MKTSIRKMEAARRLATKIETQQSVPDQVTAMIGKPSTWENNLGTNYEWAIPETTVARMGDDRRERLKALGCTMDNVDGWDHPYYWVAVRYTEKF